MAAKKPPKKVPNKPAKKGAAPTKSSKVFTDEERAAMRSRVQEMKADPKADDETAVLEKIAAMTGPDRAMAERIHALIKTAAPGLSPRLWYGMPAYALDGKVICFFQDARKFKTRYATFGFSDKAKLDDGHMWPNAYALEKLTSVEEAQIAALVKKAAG